MPDCFSGGMCMDGNGKHRVTGTSEFRYRVPPFSKIHSSAVSGHPTKEIVHLVNEESIPFSFWFSESSCHTEGYSSSLTVEPMTGTVLPKTR